MAKSRQTNRPTGKTVPVGKKKRGAKKGNVQKAGQKTKQPIKRKAKKIPIFTKMEVSMKKFTQEKEVKNKNKESTRKYRENKRKKAYPADIETKDLKKTIDGTNNVMTQL